MEPSEKLVYVFTPGKVGTTSIFVALHNSGVPAFHVHSLAAEVLQRQSEKNPCPHWVTDLQRVHPAMTFCTKRLSIISPIREPIARSAAGYFQSVRRKYETLDHEMSARSMEDLRLGFVRSRNLLRYDQWFRREFLAELHFDPFSVQFDVKNKYLIHERGRIRFCFLRSDLDLARQSEIVSEFVGQQISITMYNVGARKPLADLYERFKENLWLPEKKLEQVLKSKVFRHFFSDEEREAARAKYRQPVEA